MCMSSEGFSATYGSHQGRPFSPSVFTMACRFRGLCRPSSQARRRPSGCPESRTARAGSSVRQDSWVVFLARAAPRGRQGALLTRLRLAVNQLSPNFRLARKRRARRRRAEAERGTASTKIRVAEAAKSRTASGVPHVSVGARSIHALKSSPGPRPRGGTMLRIDTRRWPRRTPRTGRGARSLAGGVERPGAGGGGGWLRRRVVRGRRPDRGLAGSRGRLPVFAGSGGRRPRAMNEAPPQVRSPQG